MADKYFVLKGDELLIVKPLLLPLIEGPFLTFLWKKFVLDRFLVILKFQFLECYLWTGLREFILMNALDVWLNGLLFICILFFA